MGVFCACVCIKIPCNSDLMGYSHQIYRSSVYRNSRENIDMSTFKERKKIKKRIKSKTTEKKYTPPPPPPQGGQSSPNPHTPLIRSCHPECTLPQTHSYLAQSAFALSQQNFYIWMIIIHVQRLHLKLTEKDTYKTKIVSLFSALCQYQTCQFTHIWHRYV